MQDRFEEMQPGGFPRDKRTIYAMDSSATDVVSRWYEQNLGIEISELKGKKVLDIGGTFDGEFAINVKDAGVDLVTVNPFKNYGGNYGTKKVKGLAQELPFQHNTFDVVLSHATFPYLPNYESEYKDSLSGIMRVLKPGGKAIIHPITQTVFESEVFKKIIEDLSKVAEISFNDAGEFPEHLEDGEIRLIRFYRMTLIKK